MDAEERYAAHEKEKEQLAKELQSAKRKIRALKEQNNHLMNLILSLTPEGEFADSSDEELYQLKKRRKKKSKTQKSAPSSPASSDSAAEHLPII